MPRSVYPSVGHFEDGMTRSKEQVVSVTTGVVQKVGKIMKSPLNLAKRCWLEFPPMMPLMNLESRYKKEQGEEGDVNYREGSELLLRSNGVSSSAAEQEPAIPVAMEMAESSRPLSHRHHGEQEELLRENEDPSPKIEPLELERNP